MKPDLQKYKALLITARFNLAYYYEEDSKFGEASELYNKIIAEEPDYVDAYLRKAFLAQKRGDLVKARDYLDRAKKRQRNRAPVN